MIEREDRDGIVLLTLRHGKVNALDLELLAALSDELAAVEKQGAQAVVLTGNGRAFSAGVDLLRVLDGGRAYLEEFLPRLSKTLLDMVRFSIPIVGAIDGHAIAGGFILASACDRRILAEGSAKLGVTELRVGVAFPPAALELVRAVAGRWTTEMVYHGRLYDGDRSLAMGLVDEIVPADELIERAVGVAEELGRIPARAFAATKKLLNAPLLRAIASVGESTDGEILDAWSSPETGAAMRRFVDRTLSRG